MIFFYIERGMLRGSEMMYDFNCGVIVEVNNGFLGNVWYYL